MMSDEVGEGYWLRYGMYPAIGGYNGSFGCNFNELLIGIMHI